MAETLAGPYDPAFDEHNPYITDIPERFVDDEAQRAMEEEAAWQQHLEDSYDPDVEAYYADAIHAQWD